MSDFPSRMLFRPVVECPRLKRAPVIDGDLGDWKGVRALPRLGEYDGERVFAEVYVGWLPEGLYIAERCEKPVGNVAVNRKQPHLADGLQVWVDTRATQAAHRATRFCHHFILLPKGGGAPEAGTGWQVDIRRASDRPALCDPSEIVVATQVGEGFYTIEAHLPARTLNGFEAQPGTRIAFNYLVHDAQGGRFGWAAPRGFPAETDPSLWGVLELGG